jgi:hypothetical protein
MFALRTTNIITRNIFNLLIPDIIDIMHNNMNTNYDNASGSRSCPAVPILYIEESVKRYYDVKKKVKGENGGTRMRISKKKYYDVDWRFYITYRYGNYIVCGTRCPTYDYYNDKWPVISIPFTSAYDAYTYITLMTGRSKVNLTLYVSRLGGCTTDLSFAQPTGDRFRSLDVERSNRRNEMVGYDRASSYANNYADSTIFKLMSILTSAENGSTIMPFTASQYGSLHQTEWSTCQGYNNGSGNCDTVERQNTNSDVDEQHEPNGEDEQEQEQEQRHNDDANYDYNLEYDQYDDYYDYVAWDHATAAAADAATKK